MVFAGFDFYPSCGANDFVGCFDNKETAIQEGKNQCDPAQKRDDDDLG